MKTQAEILTSLHPNENVQHVSDLQSLPRKRTLGSSLFCAILLSSCSRVEASKIDGQYRVVVSEVLNCPAADQANGDCVPFEILSNGGTLDLRSEQADEYDGGCGSYGPAKTVVTTENKC